MPNTVIYALPGYPTVMPLENGRRLTVRPMVPEDSDALLDFFRRIPEQDRFYLKEDVTSPRVIGQWAENLDYGRALPLLALDGAKIVADGTLHHRRAGARRHIGEVRVVVDPAYRNMGVGRGILYRLVEIARMKKLDTLMFEVVADTEEAARKTALILGFMPVAALRDHVRDLNGKTHDLIVMELRVADLLPDEPEVF
ncbi:MAG: GNAT family N-acetyltransferase [Chloroflexi bacterium]|nr:GNAT family N-acetyltransferase [Chloroflexota bacterium]